VRGKVRGAEEFEGRGRDFPGGRSPCGFVSWTTLRCIMWQYDSVGLYEYDRKRINRKI
jgi:hypothetical protein